MRAANYPPPKKCGKGALSLLEHGATGCGQKRRRQDDREEDDNDDDEMDDEEEQAHEKEIKQQFTQRVNDKRPCRAPAKILRISKSSGFCISGHVPTFLTFGA